MTLQIKKPVFRLGGPYKGSVHGNKRGRLTQPKVDFKELDERLRPDIPSLVQRLLPHGRLERHEYVALNPTRPDRHLGSFRINTRTGRWADFATNDKGRDLVSLWAYVKDMKQLEAAQDLQNLIGRDS